MAIFRYFMGYCHVTMIANEFIFLKVNDIAPWIQVGSSDMMTVAVSVFYFQYLAHEAGMILLFNSNDTYFR